MPTTFRHPKHPHITCTLDGNGYTLLCEQCGSKHHGHRQGNGVTFSDIDSDLRTFSESQDQFLKAHEHLSDASDKTLMTELTMCPHHADMIREKIIAAGLWKYVSPNGDELKRRLAAKRESIENFDPLYNAIIGITVTTLRTTGRRVEGCPVCYVNEHCTCEVKNCGDSGMDWHVDGQKGIIMQLNAQRN